MPKTYILKKPVFDANRLQKIAKNILDEAKSDRDKALDTCPSLSMSLTLKEEGKSFK